MIKYEKVKTDGFSVRSNAVRAARSVLGEKAQQGTDFVIIGETENWGWRRHDEAPAQVVAPVLEPDEAEKKVTKPKRVKSAKSSKPKAAKKAKPAKAKKTKAPKVKKQPKSKSEKKPLRDGSKGAQIVALISRKNGATMTEIMEKVGWLRHTARGFLSTLGSKRGLDIECERIDGDSRYTLKNPEKLAA